MPDRATPPTRKQALGMLTDSLWSMNSPASDDGPEPARTDAATVSARRRGLAAAAARAAGGGTLSRPAAERLARTLRLVADPTRLQLLSMINGSPGGEVTVGELTGHLGLRQPTISHHLRLMLEDGLLTREQRGRHMWYAIAPDRRDDIADLLR